MNIDFPVYCKNMLNKHKFMASIESVEAFEIGQSYVLLDVLTINKNNYIMDLLKLRTVNVV